MSQYNDKPVSVDSQYEQISKRVADLYAAAFNGLKYFVQLYTLIIGGSVWLNGKLIETHALQSTHALYERLSDGLVFVVWAVSSLITVETTWTWTIWRKWLADITTDARIPMPMRSYVQSWYFEFFLILGMGAAALLFARFNPFTISN